MAKKTGAKKTGAKRTLSQAQKDAMARGRRIANERRAADKAAAAAQVELRAEVAKRVAQHQTPAQVESMMPGHAAPVVPVPPPASVAHPGMPLPPEVVAPQAAVDPLTLPAEEKVGPQIPVDAAAAAQAAWLQEEAAALAARQAAPAAPVEPSVDARRVITGPTGHADMSEFKVEMSRHIPGQPEGPMPYNPALLEPGREAGDGYIPGGDALGQQISANMDGPSDADFHRAALRGQIPGGEQVAEAQRRVQENGGIPMPVQIVESPRVAWAREAQMQVGAGVVQGGSTPQTPGTVGGVAPAATPPNPDLILRKMLMRVAARVGSGHHTREFCQLCESTGVHGRYNTCDCPCHEAWRYVAHMEQLTAGAGA